MRSVFLYGGCVIRDSFSMFPDGFDIRCYVARQSLISAMGGCVVGLPSPNLSSSFQKRMVLGDIQSNLLDLLEELASGTDLIIMDTNIERVGVFDFGGGRFVTRSHEFFSSGVLDRLVSKPRWIPLRSVEYQTLYRDAAERFVLELDRLGAADRVLVIDAEMAEIDSDGVSVDMHMGRPVGEMRLQLTELSLILEGLGLKVERMPSELAVADVSHQWGRSPLHYTAPAAAWLASTVRKYLPE